MRSTIHSILFNVIVLSLFISYVVVAIKVEDSKSNNNHNHNIWSPVPTIFWTFDKTNKVNTVTAPKYENDILSMDTVVERFNTQLFNNNAAKHLIIGFLYDKLNTQEFSKYIGAYHTKNSNKIGEKIMKEAKSTLVLPYTERPSSIEAGNNQIPFYGMLQANAEAKGWYAHELSVTSLFTKADLNKLLTKHQRVYLTIRMPSSSSSEEKSISSMYSSIFAMLKDVGQYSAFITGETSEMIPLNVGKSILIDDDDESSIFVEMAELSGRRSLADMNEKAEVPQKITAYVPTTPETMAATLIMLFLFYVLWAAIGCMTAIPSAQKMFQQPPGPKDGDPQYANTVNEGKRYYPYRNLPQKEY